MARSSCCVNPSRCGSAVIRTRSICGTGRCSCLPRPNSGHCRSPLALLLVALAVGLSAASLRLVEDPVRHSPWLASRAARGLMLGASAVRHGGARRGVAADHRRRPRLGRVGRRTDAWRADDHGRADHGSPANHVGRCSNRHRRRASRALRRVASMRSLPPTAPCSSRVWRSPTSRPICARRWPTSVRIERGCTATTVLPSGGSVSSTHAATAPKMPPSPSSSTAIRTPRSGSRHSRRSPSRVGSN